VLPLLRAGVHGRSDRWSPGGILITSADRLYEEIGYLAYHFHWSQAELLDLEHPVRRRYVQEVARLNQRLTEEG
jgi:hypothetical protein